MMTTELKSQQRTVILGMGLGIIAFLTVVVGVSFSLAPFSGLEAASSRLIFVFGCGAFAVIPLLIGVELVGNSRFRSAAINPLAGAETDSQKVYGRYLSNTLEQTTLFIPVLVALSLFLDSSSMRLIPALIANFIVGRLTFLAGYLKNPHYRAPGFAMTMYPTVISLIYVLYKLLTLGIPKV
jgi:hypothetical protein